jgi:hypothetical protein
LIGAAGDGLRREIRGFCGLNHVGLRCVRIARAAL